MSEWITVDACNIPKFRAAIISKYGTDIHAKEGLWFSYMDIL